MAPGLVESLPEVQSFFSYDKPSKTIFPDGIKTSGQCPPEYEQLQPYSAFPEQIIGPTVWRKDDYVNNPERWTHYFSEEEVAELNAASDAFIKSGTPLTGITKEKFPLPAMTPLLTALRNELLNGKGFILFKGFPVNAWGNEKSAVAYMGLGVVTFCKPEALCCLLEGLPIEAR